MAVAMFHQNDACRLLAKKSVLMFGDSNMRAIYKDLVWLLEEGTLIPKTVLRRKNERSHANDRRISDGVLTASRNYQEVREYDMNAFVRFEFITRLCPEKFLAVHSMKVRPDVVIVNSCVWDLSRWGPNGVADYLKNFECLVQFIKENFNDRTQFVWLTTLPPSFKCRGGFLTEDIGFLNKILPVNVIEANKFAVDCLRKHGFEVIDLHYFMRLLIDMRCSDGIHWDPKPTRYIVNVILNHLSLSWKVHLPIPISSSNREFNENHEVHRPRKRNVCGKNKGRLTRNENISYDYNNVAAKKKMVHDKIDDNEYDFTRDININDRQFNNFASYNDLARNVQNKYRFTNVDNDVFVFGNDKDNYGNIVQRIDHCVNNFLSMVLNMSNN